jgi:dienelactone hydrolase
MFQHKGVVRIFAFFILLSFFLISINKCTKEKKPQIIVKPRTALLGTPALIKLSGLQSGETVLIRAHTRDGKGVVWESKADFSADRKGNIDINEQSPIAGDYTGIDPLGLFWAMKPKETSDKEWIMYDRSGIDGMTISLTAEVQGLVKASEEFERLFRHPDSKLTRQPVKEEGLVGTLFHPNSGGPHPGIIFLGGSGGGLDESCAALLGSYGYSALALAYFGVDPLPKELIEIPLEYFEKAITWLRNHSEVNEDRIAVMGISKGGELSLLLGANYPEIKVVVAYVPSGLIWQGISKVSISAKSSWSKDGKGLPFAYFNMPEKDKERRNAGLSVALRETYNPERNDPTVIQEATIPVEKTNGPILLISGKDDQMWPSDIFSDMVIERLKEFNHPFANQHLCYEEAGHFILMPYLPTTTHQKIPWFVIGGTPKADAHASTDSWDAMLEFLDKHLRK